MTAFIIKLVAIFAMLIDHIGAVLLPEYILLRIIGRITFPVMAFFVAEGCKHTRNIDKYIINLFAFALISEIPFDLAMSGNLVNNYSANVIWTFLLAAIGIKYYEQYKENHILSFAILVSVSTIAGIVNTDYAFMGVILVLLLYLADYPALIIGFWSLSLYGASNIFLGVLPAIAMIKLHNGERGISRNNVFGKYLFYAFYPLHLICLAIAA